MERFDGIVVRGGETVFRCEAVFDGNDDGVGVVCEVGASVLEKVGGCAEEDEAAAVKVNDERELCGGGGVNVAREEYASEGVV